MYLVLVECKIEKQFSPQVQVSVNVRVFISFMSSSTNVFVGFTDIAGVTTTIKKLINYIGL